VVIQLTECRGRGTGVLEEPLERHKAVAPLKCAARANRCSHGFYGVMATETLPLSDRHARQDRVCVNEYPFFGHVWLEIQRRLDPVLADQALKVIEIQA
jgi:hypothetical protein